MTKQSLYTYLGTNGIITSPVHLEDIYYVPKYRLIADEGKKLTKDMTNFLDSITIPVDEIEDWVEVEE